MTGGKVGILLGMIMTEKKYYIELDTLKGMSIFCVLLCHAIILYPVNLKETPFWGEVFTIMGSVPMPLFFLASGYCFSYKGNYKEFIKAKILRILLPYVVFGLIDMIPRQLLSSLVNRPGNVWDSLKSMLLYGGQYWFLYTLFVIFLIYPLIYIWQKDSKVRMVITEVILLVLTLIKVDISLFCVDSILFYLIYFNTGSLLKSLKIDVFQIKIPSDRVRPVLILLSAIAWCVFSLSLPYNTVTRMLFGILGIITFYLLTKYKVVNTLFAGLGRYSLQLYLLNGFLLVLSRTIICRVTQIPTVIVLFNLFITMVCSYIFIKYVCERIKFVKKIMGM